VTAARRTRGAHLEHLNTCQYVRAHAESEAVNFSNIRCHNALPVGVGVSPLRQIPRVYDGMVTCNLPGSLVVREWRFAWCSTLLAGVLQSPPTTH